MVNLRYHIVSLTAVFLALGIGLTLGSVFLERVTVETLEAQLSTLDQNLRQARDQNHDLSRQVEVLTAREDALSDALDDGVLEGHLAEVPVLVLATEGTAPELVARTAAVLGSAGAEVAGTWWLTARFSLEGEADVAALADALGLTTTQAERARRSAVVRLSEVLLDAAEPAEPEAPGDVPLAEPALAGALRAAGFLDYTPPVGADGDVVELRPRGVRYVLVADPDGAEPAVAFAEALVEEMARPAPVPLVVAQGPGADVQVGGQDEGEARTSVVGPLRRDEVLSVHLSTVDALDLPSGLLATVLALADLADPAAPVVGHYGVTESAMRLLPAGRGA